MENERERASEREHERTPAWLVMLAILVFWCGIAALIWVAVK